MRGGAGPGEEEEGEGERRRRAVMPHMIGGGGCWGIGVGKRDALMCSVPARCDAVVL